MHHPGDRRAGGGRTARVELGLSLAIVLWGVNYAVIKSALTQLQPLAFNAVRFVLATLTLIALVRGRGPMPRIPRGDLARLALLGLLGHAVYQMLFIAGIARTTAANASLIMGTCPMLVAILGTALGRDRLPPAAWAGVVLAAAGLVLVLTAGGRHPAVTGALGGDLLVLASGVVWAVYTVLASTVMARTPARAATLVTFLAGTPALVVAAIPSLASQDWRSVGAAAWLGAAFSGVLAIGIAYALWNAGLAALGGSRTAVFQNFTPVVAAATAWLTLGEHWTPGQFAGAAAVLAGIALTRRPPAPAAPGLAPPDSA